MPKTDEERERRKRAAQAMFLGYQNASGVFEGADMKMELAEVKALVQGAIHLAFNTLRLGGLPVDEVTKLLLQEVAAEVAGDPGDGFVRDFLARRKAERGE